MTVPRQLTWFTLGYAVLFIFSAVAPNSQSVWIAEIIPVMLMLALTWWISTLVPLSKTAYCLIFIWMALHTIGAKYTFAEVPFGWFNQLIGSERNNFDRVAHFAIGLYAYPIAEVVIRRRLAPSCLARAFALFVIMSIAAGYEIVEWWYADLAGGENGIAFLGSQGDIWDAQKDMLCDTLGALCALSLLSWQCRHNPRRFQD